MFLAPPEFIKSPEALAHAYTDAAAREYTHWLATHHYENFHVVTVLLPRALHQDFYNVYAFCRWSDDLGDEIGDPSESLRLLEWWCGELNAMYEGRATHPVFVALRETVERHQLPKEPFADLIRAFVQDQTVTRYRSWDEVFRYCRYSASPVGRVLLYLCGYRDAERQSLSDATCTALQLANFWQDVSVDLAKGRVYLPIEVLEANGSSLADVEAGRETPQFRNAVREAVGVARDLFLRGLPLAGMVSRRLAVDLELFSRGGMLVLDKIEARGYNVLSGRPSVTSAERAWLFARTLARHAFSRPK